MRRILLGLVLALTVAGAARQPGPPPLDLPPITAAALAERYAVNGPGRQFLAIDRSGDGRAIEVVGDLAAAATVIVFVPGTGYGLREFDDGSAAPGGAARALYERARALAPGTSVAVIGWLGYDAPEMTNPSVATTVPADEGAEALRTLVGALRGKERIALVCHSYGSVVCGRAAPGLPVADIVALGSPGMGVPALAELRTPARVWATLAARDDVFRPGLLLGPIGFGADPNLPGFGARRFDGGSGGHTGYLRPGPVLDRITTIALTGAISSP
ncbi:alpha/beta fold hydrolase [Nonomuraea typhae]|uniref:alpha/beta fold hydrolase n=1 Tax=Nonomuraea typhae TaxID=2603600 RepID=UPI0012F8A135|nr:alpha/beta hydrolase [Nonomuraea typhae]